MYKYLELVGSGGLNEKVVGFQCSKRVQKWSLDFPSSSSPDDDDAPHISKKRETLSQTLSTFTKRGATSGRKGGPNCGEKCATDTLLLCEVGSRVYMVYTRAESKRNSARQTATKFGAD